MPDALSTQQLPSAFSFYDCFLFVVHVAKLNNFLLDKKNINISSYITPSFNWYSELIK